MGHRKLFWLDTGAGMTVIPRSLAAQCDINVMDGEEMKVGNSTNKNVDTELAIIDSIEIEGLLIQNQPALVLKDEYLHLHNPKTQETVIIEGIIGWDIIQHLFLEINYSKKQAAIQEPQLQSELKGNNLFFCGAPIVMLKAEDGSPLYFGLDTGASRSHFGRPLIAKFPHLDISKRRVHAGGIGEVKEIEADSLSSLHVFLHETHRIELYNIREMLSDFASFFHLDGVLGSDAAKDSSLIIDYKNRRIEITN
ncbi:hypothetical protein FZC84_13500 [Rossellomorea vietnamensis]|uniref:Aspartyl protease n=1 Tax=Rossellomorea vietnamensis TaxID=218284 RepID=A0A5D4MBC1_9BACI|nr:retropepsin-like aspartic protease [Rossellomorea vietnamensis]TYR98727.1 hypothetical protein FZC84_13500 [Rossellomorea vietnamensis]